MEKKQYEYFVLYSSIIADYSPDKNYLKFNKKYVLALLRI